jgi:hypothetical protein
MKKTWVAARRRILLSLALLAIIASAFPWLHAAMAYLVHGPRCPPAAIARAQAETASLFGSLKSRPLWLCVDKPLLGLDVSHGSTRSFPFLPSVIIVGKKGARPPVMAHELVHAELARRTESWLRMFLFPAWFDEGLAMQLDRRRPYDRRALINNIALMRKGRLRKPDLKALAWSVNFFTGGRQERFHYGFARCVVRKWLASQPQARMPHGSQPHDRRSRAPQLHARQPHERRPRARLEALLAQTGWTHPFPQAGFEPLAAKCLNPRSAQ